VRRLLLCVSFLAESLCVCVCVRCCCVCVCVCVPVCVVICLCGQVGVAQVSLRAYVQVPLE
jgi:hypothetical protein